MSDDRRPTVNLAAVSLPVPEEFQAPRLLSDAVPSLRKDLRIDQKPGAAGLFEVGREGDERRFTLYDFEVSIARMLDGHRPVSELIEAASKIGIPITLESFQKFARQMHAYGFLAAAAELGNGPWAPRDEWRPEVRELFQSALRTYRMERPQEALGYVEALEQIEQGLSEVSELRARIEEQIAGGAEKLPTFAELHGAELVDDLSGKTDRYGTVADPSSRPTLKEWPRAVTGELRLLFSNITQKKKGRAPLVVGVAAIALLAGAAVPFPSRVVAQASLAPSTPPAAVKSPREGKLASLAVAPGSWVEAGQTLATLDEAELSAKASALEQQLAALDAQIGKLEERAQTRSAKKAASSLEKAQQALASVQERVDHYLSRGAKRSAARLEKKLKSRQRSVEKAQHKLDRISHPDELAQAKAQRAQQTTALEALKQALAHSKVIAGGAGVFSTARQPGDALTAGAEVGTLTDTRALTATLTLPASAKGRVKPGAPVTLQLGGPALKAQIATLGAKGDTAQVRLANPERKLAADARGSAEIDTGSRSVLGRLF